MCGIAGVIRIHDPSQGPPPPPLEAIPEAWLDVLDESIKHRGPDGQGRFRDRAIRPDGTVVDVALVHRRLSIIDHAGGHQPMVHDGQRLRPDLTYQPGETPKLAHEIAPGLPLVTVAFNGCIYNHRELRAELEAAGHVFETDHSDTEVLVHGWRAWGANTLRFRIDGMYAQLCWNRTSSQLLCGTDESGEKPLYETNLSTHSAVAISQIPATFPKLLRYLNPAEVAPDDEFVTQWLLRGTSNSLPAIGDQIHPRGWKSWPETTKLFSAISGSQAALLPKRGDSQAFQGTEDVIVALKQAIEDRIEADVPIGVFLSGGIDSSIIAAIANRVTDAPIRTYTVRMPHEDIDESTAAKAIASHLGTEHLTLECDLHPAEDVIELTQTTGVPFGDSSLLPSYWIAKAASREIKVALGGDGGDELFGGYRRHVAALWADKISDKSMIFSLALSLTEHLLPCRQTRSKWCDAQRFLNAYSGEGYADTWNIFSRRDLNQLLKITWDMRETIFFPCPDRLRHDYLNYLPLDILRKTDSASMMAPIELRSPFLAKNIVERAFATPKPVLMPNGERKGLLKQVARKYLPDHIVDRPKQGFAIPIGEWFRTDYGDMRQLLYDHLESTDPFPGLADAGVEINMKFVHQMLKEHDAAGEKSINPWHGRDHSQRLYMLLVLSIWSKWLERVRTL